MRGHGSVDLPKIRTIGNGGMGEVLYKYTVQLPHAERSVDAVSACRIGLIQ